MKAIKYPKHYRPESGEWVPHKANMEWQCCDCGLVHNVWFRIGKNGILEVKMTLNNKQTQLNRVMGVEIRKKKIVELHEKGLSLRQIAVAVNLKSANTVNYYLKKIIRNGKI